MLPGLRLAAGGMFWAGCLNAAPSLAHFLTNGAFYLMAKHGWLELEATFKGRKVKGDYAVNNGGKAVTVATLRCVRSAESAGQDTERVATRLLIEMAAEGLA